MADDDDEFISPAVTVGLELGVLVLSDDETSSVDELDSEDELRSSLVLGTVDVRGKSDSLLPFVESLIEALTA